MSEQNINQFLKIGGSRLLLDLLISIILLIKVLSSNYVDITFSGIVDSKADWLQQG